MRVSQILSRTVSSIEQHMTVARAARLMKREAIGFLPVVTDRDGKPELVGVITDRDLVLRTIALGKDPDRTQVVECMSPYPLACGLNDTVARALELMTRYQIRRLPVVTAYRQLVGVLSLGDILRSDAAPASDCLRAVRRTHARKRAKRIAQPEVMSSDASRPQVFATPRS